MTLHTPSRLRRSGWVPLRFAGRDDAGSRRHATARRRKLELRAVESLESRVMLSTAMPVFEGIQPLGAMAYRSTAFGTAGAGSESPEGPFTFHAAAGQRIAVSVAPEGAPGLDIAFDLRDPTGSPIGSANARGAGVPELLAPLAVPVDGLYQVVPRAVGGSGSFRVDVLAGGAFEAAGPGGAGNDTPAAAEDINAGFNDIDGASIGAVVGTISDAVVVNGAAENFESGALGPAFSTRVTGPGQGIGVRVGAVDPTRDTNNILQLWGDYGNGVGALVEAVWTVNLSGAADVNLGFRALFSSNHTNPFAGDFVGHANATGVAISANGIDWHPVVSLPDRNDFQTYTVDLDAAAASAGMPLAGNFKIKFQYYDDYTFGSSGAFFDDLKVTRSDEDWYAFAAAAGDHLSLQADVDGGVLELYDPQGRLAGVGRPTPDGSRGVAIQDVDAAAGGTYRARVAAPSATAYGLAVYRNASLNLAPHHLADAPQDLRETGRVAGAASINSGRLFGYRWASSGVASGIIEIDPRTGATLTRLGDGFYGVTTTPTSVLATAPSPEGGRQLVELDPDTGAPLRTIPLAAGMNADGLVYHNGEVVLSSGHVLNYNTRQLVRTIPAPGSAITSTGGRLIGVGVFANVGYGLFEIDPQTGQKVGFGEVITLSGTDAQPEALAAIGNDLYLRLSGSARVYVIDLATQHVLRSFDTPSNDGYLQGDFGSDGGPPGNRFFSVPARVGDVVRIVTSTPGDGPFNAPVNTLDPVVDLYSPSGQLLFTAGAGAFDGKNVSLQFTATQAGDYRFRLRASAGSGDFVLTASGFTGASPELAVAATDPGNGAVIAPPQSMTVDFSSPLAALSVQASDLTVDGRPATGFAAVDADTVRFDLPTTGQGRHVVRVAAGAVTDAAGTGVQEYFGEFTVNEAAPRVVSTSLAQGAELLPGPLTLEVRFDQPLAAAALDPSDFALVAADSGPKAPTAWSYDAGTMTLRAEYGALPGDQYTFTLYSGNGRFEGVSGGDLDGEAAAGAAPSGNGVPGGSFALDFSLQQPNAVAAPSNLVAYPISASEIEITWRDNSTGERGFRVDRAVGEGDFVKLADVAANAIRYNDTTAAAGFYYRYRVRAYVVAGPSAWSDPFTATALPPELTTPVKQFAPLPEVETPLDADPTVVLTVAPGVGVFMAKDSSAENLQRPHVQVWLTNGTPSGTVLLKDLGAAGQYGSLGVTNGAAIFYYRDPTSDQVTLWRSDGTAAGTVALAPLGVGAVEQRGSADGVVYFLGPSSFWRTDGTAAGTYPATGDVPPAPDERGTTATIDGVFYGVDDRGLYKRVGPPGSETVLLKPVNPGGFAYRLTVAGNKLAFLVQEWEDRPDGGMNLNNEVWATDGTVAGTVRLVKFPYGGNLGIAGMTMVGDTLYFMVNNGGSSIWKSDLTPQGTSQVMTVGGVADRFAAFGNLLTFAAGPKQLWATDGTAAGTRRISNIGALVRPSHPDWLTKVGNTVFFTSSGQYTDGHWLSAYGDELWKTDGTPEGTTRLYRGLARDLINFNGTLFFAGYRPQGGFELWKSDGTEAGTVRVKDVRPNDTSTQLRLLAVSGGQLFFAVAIDPYYGTDYELWKTDGTEAGTSRIGNGTISLDIVSDAAPNARGNTAAAGGYLYFRRSNGGGDLHSTELWRTDGTDAGTVRCGSVIDPLNFTEYNGSLICSAFPNFQGSESLYKVNPGSPQPTLLKSFNQGGWVVSDITRVGARLFFAAPSSGGVASLWRTDGTVGGTAVVRAVGSTVPQSSVARVLHITDVDGTAYFVLSETDPDGMDGINGKLWKSDGTSAGTVQVRDFNSPVYATPIFFTSAGGKLVYSDGTDLWRSNGTRGGTVQILRLRDPSVAPFFPPQFGGTAAVAVGDQLYFSASVPGADPRSRELRIASLTTPDAPSDLIVVDQPPPEEGAARGPLPAGVVYGIAALDPTGTRLSWRDNSPNESGFLVERSRTSDFALPDHSFFRPANSTSFVDTTGAPGTLYYYRVRAVNAGGESPFSNNADNKPAVVGRLVFYNNSAYDGNAAAAGAADDAAIATDKRALLPGGGPATRANFTTYTRGINGVMVDVSRLPGGARPDINADDFEVMVGGTAAGGWSAGPRPVSVTVRRGAGAGGSDRVTLVWADGAIRYTWLRLTVKAHNHTGLAAPDVFYFGNLAGDTGDADAGPFAVNAQDLAAVKRALNKASDIAGRFDLNRDGRVNAQDLAAVKQNINRVLGSVVVAPAAVFSNLQVLPAASADWATATVKRQSWDELTGAGLLT